MVVVRPKRKAVGNSSLSSPGLSVDFIDALLDELLHRILFFLPVQDAEQTCVLGHHWCHLWKTAPYLRISWVDDIGPFDVGAMKRITKFVNTLLLLRDNYSPIQNFVIDLPDIEEDGEELDDIMIWINHVLKRNAEFLGLQISRDAEEVCIDVHGFRLYSLFLRILELAFIKFDDRFLDFLSCPALEVLKVSCCDLSCATKISSRSLKRLSILASKFSRSVLIRVDLPILVSLRLEVNKGKIPMLKRMPSLVDAVVELGYSGSDYCSSHVDTNILQGLSEAKCLELISTVNMCVPDKCALAVILQQSPVLEELTLQLLCKGGGWKVEMKGRKASEVSRAICNHLKIVRLQCVKVNKKVLGVLTYLSELNIWFQFSMLNHCTPVQGGAASGGGHPGNQIILDSDD